MIEGGMSKSCTHRATSRPNDAGGKWGVKLGFFGYLPMERVLARSIRRIPLLVALLNSSCSPKDDAGPRAFEGTSSGLVFQPGRGFYDAPLDVTLSHPRATEVRYTLDSSDPRNSGTAMTATLPLVVHVDPSDTSHRYLAPGVVLRASVGGSAAVADL